MQHAGPSTAAASPMPFDHGSNPVLFERGHNLTGVSRRDDQTADKSSF